MEAVTKSQVADRLTSYSPAAENVVVLNEKEKVVTVVLLGWLGAKTKHLMRYMEWYNSKGMYAITFVVEPKDLFQLDKGKGLAKRMSNLADDIVSWVSGKEEDGRERCLVFHTFSNTGWNVYGVILHKLQGRQDVMEKIKACVVDSGGGDPSSPKVWATGCATALLKKSNNTTKLSDVNSSSSSKIQEEEQTPMYEILIVSFLEKCFSIILPMCDANWGLTKATSTLKRKQPINCGQLYLYSKADKVVPFESVELLIEDQRKMGIKVSSFDFGSSPHVNHFRYFPDVYLSQLTIFLDKCFETAPNTSSGPAISKVARTSNATISGRSRY